MPEPKTVLVADDERMVLDVVTTTLRKAGFHVLSASGGKRAVALARQSDEPICLTVLDMVMPDLNGPDVFAQVRESHPQMRALFVSGYPIIPGTVPAGSDFLEKPFTSAQLLRKVIETLERPFTQRA